MVNQPNPNRDLLDETLRELGEVMFRTMEIADQVIPLPGNNPGYIGKTLILSKLLEIAMVGDFNKDSRLLKTLHSLLEGQMVRVGRLADVPPEKALDILLAERAKELEEVAPQKKAVQKKAVSLEAATGNTPSNTEAYKQFERCVIAIADACDGAATWDGAGFNKPDSGFGKSIASRIKSGGKLSTRQVVASYKMMIKYRKQLAGNDLTLPEYNDVVSGLDSLEVHSKPSKRLEVANNNEIHVYTTYEEKDHFKAVGAIEFNRTIKAWIFSAKKAIALVEAARKLGDYDISVGIERLCEIEKKRQEDKKKQQEKEALKTATELDKLIQSANLEQPIACGWSLFDHQKEAAKWLLSHGKMGIFQGGILADQMGLGKSISALAAAKAASQCYSCHVIVVCPASLKDNWLIEAERVGVKIDVYSWAKMPSPPKSEDVRYILIADEAHYAQNPKSKRTKQLWELARATNCLSAWLLTGTPLKNGRPINLYPLLYAVKHPLSDNRRDYEMTYCNAAYRVVNSKGREVWDNLGASQLDDLSRQTQNVILQRKKEDCLDLPEKIRTYRAVDLSSVESKAHQDEINATIRDYRDRVEAGEVSKDAEALVTLGAMRRIGSKYKAVQAVETTFDLLDQGESVVIFTEFLESAHAIADAIRLNKIKVELLDGSVPADDRQAMVDRFQSGESRVFVGTIRAGGVGITLTKSHYVIMADRPWTPGDAEQAEDRCHRIGTTDTVISIWLQLGEIDSLVDALIEKKQDRIDLVMSGKRKTLRGVGNINQLAKELINDLASKL